MSPFRIIRSRVIAVAGDPTRGWGPADPDDLSAEEVPFDFSITSDGNANFLLVYRSVDGRYAADDWHETMDDALSYAFKVFGIEPGEWQGSQQ
jgi:hypothetical protein